MSTQIEINSEVVKYLASSGYRPDSIIDEVYSSHFVEHVSDISMLIEELARIVKKDGIVDFKCLFCAGLFAYLCALVRHGSGRKTC